MMKNASDDSQEGAPPEERHQRRPMTGCLIALFLVAALLAAGLMLLVATS